MTHRSPDNTSRRTAVFAGSFDPFTRGHLSIAARGAALFDRLIIAVGVNAAKAPAPEALQERVGDIERAVATLDPELASRCSVAVYSGELTVDFARRNGARWLLRGARSGAEFDAETRLADVNRAISGLETVILPTLPELSACSSSVVRELRSYGHDASIFLP